MPTVKPPNDDLESVFADLLVEIEQRLRSGRPIDWDAYRSNYPDYFDELLRLLPTLVELNRLDNVWEDQ
ncbi:MAG: hypothetical protein GXY83_31615 [Rhodopirellula sp.]|nr:hypothetical protein [Rhodopirellula sp.]